MKNRRKRPLIVMTAAALTLALFTGTAHAADRGGNDRSQDRRDTRHDQNDQRRNDNQRNDNNRRDNDRHDNNRRDDHDRGRDHDNKANVIIRLGQNVVRPVPVYVTGGYYRTDWVPPVYVTRYDSCGQLITVCISEGYFTRIWVPLNYSTIDRRDTIIGSSSRIIISGSIKF